MSQDGLRIRPFNLSAWDCFTSVESYLNPADRMDYKMIDDYRLSIYDSGDQYIKTDILRTSLVESGWPRKTQDSSSAELVSGEKCDSWID